MKVLQPAGWPRPKGYSNGISARGRLVVTGGMVGWNDQEIFESPHLVDQFEQALLNVLAVLAEGGAGPGHIVRMTCYVIDIEAYHRARAELGPVWKRVMGDHYPAMALVAVTRLVEPGAEVEIDAMAVVEE